MTVRAETGGRATERYDLECCQTGGLGRREGNEAQHPHGGQREAGRGKLQTRLVADSSEKKPEEKLEAREARAASWAVGHDAQTSGGPENEET